MIGQGFYTAAEAARLISLPSHQINRWLGGYTYAHGNKKTKMPPLWVPDLPKGDNQIELSFRDLMELRFVKAFIDAGLSVKTVRNCIEYARECIKSERPFSSRKFRTDGKTIFLESAKRSGDHDLLDLKNHQYAIKDAISQSFKDIEVNADIVVKWWPYEGKKTIVVDPTRCFGQPILDKYAIPTATLLSAVKAEGENYNLVSKYFDIPVPTIKEAVLFEKSMITP